LAGTAREGDVEEGSLMCGQVGGMIREVVAAKELMACLVSGCDSIVDKAT